MEIFKKGWGRFGRGRLVSTKSQFGKFTSIECIATHVFDVFLGGKNDQLVLHLKNNFVQSKKNPTPVVFIGGTIAHGPSPQPTACR